MGRAGGGQVAAHQPGQFAADGQAQARAAVLAHHGGVELVERGEQARQGRLGDAGAGVDHLDRQQQLTRRRLNIQGDGDRARAR
jgi:hypothetical protein